MGKRHDKRTQSSVINETQLAADYHARWKMINDRILELDRKVPVGQRYRDFLQMVQLSKAMNWQTSTPEENSAVTRLWNQIREAERRKKKGHA